MPKRFEQVSTQSQAEPLQVVQEMTLVKYASFPENHGTEKGITRCEMYSHGSNKNAKDILR